MRVPIYAANWKMNKRLADIGGYVSTFNTKLSSFSKKAGKDYETVVAAQAIHLPELIAKSKGTVVQVAAQNCGPAKSGAYTGEVSPVVLKEMGCPWVIIGHSERRHTFKETEAIIESRVKASVAEGLKTILCIGEQIESRREGKTKAVVESQLSILKNITSDQLWDNLVLAYEPVWAIGTGETATPEQAQEVHAHIRLWLTGQGWGKEATNIRILYGGSAKPSNSETLMAQKDVDGFLVGTASLDATTFADLIGNGLKS